MNTRTQSAARVAPEWPMPRWSTGLWLAIIGRGWWSDAAANAEASRAGVIATIAATLSHFVAAGFETGYYVAAWRSAGRRLRFGWFFSWVMTLSLIDLLAASLRNIALRHPAALPWLVALAGPGLVPERVVPTGLDFSIGSFGLLTLARCSLCGWLQAREAGVRLWSALALVFLTWIATRLILWWGIDLARGTSPLP